MEATSGDKARQTIEVPVRGYVAVGTIHPSASPITIVGSIWRDFNFSFRNGFEAPLAVFAVRCTSGLFQFPRFQPFAVPPEAESDLIRIFSALPPGHHRINDS
jgi:hypothetical protein